MYGDTLRIGMKLPDVAEARTKSVCLTIIHNYPSFFFNSSLIIAGLPLPLVAFIT